MVNLFEISINLFEEMIISTFMMLYFGNKYDNFMKYIGFISVVIVSSATITFFNYFYIYEGLLGLIFDLIYAVYAIIFLKGDTYTKIFISGFINCITYFIAVFSALCISMFYNQTGYPMYSESNYRIALIVMSKLLLILSCIILLRFRFYSIGKKRNIIILIFMTIAVEMSLVGIMDVFLADSEMKKELLLASVSVMAANAITYFAFVKINSDLEKELKIKFLEQKEEYDKRHANEIDELYAKTCSIRHDLLHHIETINGLMDEGNEKARNYIKSITQDQIQHIKQFIKTDNEYFDAIVNAKLALCDKLGIEVRTRIMTGALERLNNYEIASLFGNLFDNAIEASKNTKDKLIDLDVQLQKRHLSIFMRNSIDKSVLENNKKLQTTKKNKDIHGLGTKNIQKIVDEKKGIVNYFEENGYFCCDILI